MLPVAPHFSYLHFVAEIKGQTMQITRSKADALRAYEIAKQHFGSLLSERREQINSRQLPNLPGQELYLARNSMLSAYKDSDRCRPIDDRETQEILTYSPPAYFDADNEPLLDEYASLFVAHAGAAFQCPRNRIHRSKTSFDWGQLLHAPRALMRRMPGWQAASASGSFLPRQTASKTSAMRARIPTKEVSRLAWRRTKMAGENGRQLKTKSTCLIPL